MNPDISPGQEYTVQPPSITDFTHWRIRGIGLDWYSIHRIDKNSAQRGAASAMRSASRARMAESPWESGGTISLLGWRIPGITTSTALRFAVMHHRGGRDFDFRSARCCFCRQFWQVCSRLLSSLYLPLAPIQAQQPFSRSIDALARVEAETGPAPLPGLLLLLLRPHLPFKFSFP